MCGRYWLDPEEADSIDTINRAVKFAGEISPGDHVSAVCYSRSGNIRSFSMQWGWKLGSGKILINARSETADQKAIFADSMARRRCLLKMSAYYEWEKRGRDKIKYRIFPEEKGDYYLCGLYRFEESGPAFTILTREAAEEIRFIHSRMPLIIKRENTVGWLNGTYNDFRTSGEFTFELAL